jgi:hypothetical protein
MKKGKLDELVSKETETYKETTNREDGNVSIQSKGTFIDKSYASIHEKDIE